MDTFALILLLAAYLAFAWKTAVAWLSRRFYRRRMNRAVMLLSALLVPYALVTLPTLERDRDAFANDLLAMAAYVFVPGALAIYRQRVTRPKPKPLDLADLLIILVIWLPLEFDWLPAASVAVAGESVPVEKLTGVVLLLLIFFVFRPLAQIGFNFEFTGRDVQRVGKAFLVFAAVSVPLGLVSGFLEWDPPSVINADELVLRFVGIYLLVGLPEELLFRGVIQNLLEKRPPQEKYAALIVAALIFGAAHLNNAPAPNYRYALLATMAGVAYGWVWMRTRKVTAAALTHTLVGWVWVVLLGG